jgi:hypothetical protein
MGYHFLCVHDIRTSKETHLGASIDFHGNSFTFVYIDKVRTSRETPVGLHGLLLGFTYLLSSSKQTLRRLDPLFVCLCSEAYLHYAVTLAFHEVEAVSLQVHAPLPTQRCRLAFTRTHDPTALGFTHYCATCVCFVTILKLNSLKLDRPAVRDTAQTICSISK